MRAQAVWSTPRGAEREREAAAAGAFFIKLSCYVTVPQLQVPNTPPTPSQVSLALEQPGEEVERRRGDRRRAMERRGEEIRGEEMRGEGRGGKGRTEEERRGEERRRKAFGKGTPYLKLAQFFSSSE